MRLANILLFAVAAMNAGCSSELPPLHPIRLEFPQLDCHVEPSPCIGFIGCYRLGIEQLHITVGPNKCEETIVLCDVNAAVERTQVYYQPGQDYYIVSASYERNGSTEEISAGPFSEDENQTPWKLAIRR